MKTEMKNKKALEVICMLLIVFATLFLTIFFVFSTSGCSKNNSYNGKNYPIVTKEQEEKIRERVLNSVIAAIQKGDESALNDLATDSALDYKKAQMALQQSQEIKSQISISTKPLSIGITESSSWPRSYSAISSISETQQTESLLLFKQKNPANQYKLAACVRTFSETIIPSFGKRDLSAVDSSQLKLAPMEALKQYADMLKYNEKSIFNSAFENDPLKNYISQLNKTVDSQVQKDGGSQEQNFFVNENINGIETSNGGAIIFGQINSTWIRTAASNHYSRPLNELEEILAKNTNNTSTLSVDYINIIALYIPPKNSNELIRPLGGDRIPYKVSALN